MKRTLVCALYLMAAITGFAQSLLQKEVRIAPMHAPVKQILNAISKEGGFTFSYSSEINTEKSVAFAGGTKNVYTLLNELFEGKVNFVENKRKIILTQKPVTDPYKKITIKGRVIDKKANNPIVAANVYLSYRNSGTITNDEGRFTLTLKLSELSGSEALNISFLGYETEARPIPAADTFITVALRPSRTDVNEVVIEHHNPEILLRKVIERIPQNYEANPVLLTAFSAKKYIATAIVHQHRRHW